MKRVRLAFAAVAMIGERHLQRGVDGLAAGIGEEAVVEIARRQQRQPRRQLEHAGDGRTGRAARNRASRRRAGSP